MVKRLNGAKARSRSGGILLALCALALPGAARGDGELLMDDFEDRDLEAAPGVSWVLIGDELMGGASTGRLTIVAGAEGSRGALAFSGELAPGARGAFSSVWTAIGPEGAPRDLSAYTGLRFRARGTPGPYSAGVRPAGGSFNFVAPFEVGTEWREFELPFSHLRPQPPQEKAEWSAGALAWVGFSAAAPAGAGSGFRIELDDVAFVAAPAPAFMRVGKLALDDAGPLAALRWRPLASDPAGDGTSPRLPDAAALAWAPDGDGRVWFRLGLHGPAPERWLGLNVALDVDGDPTNGMAWWGANKAFHFDRLATAYLWPGAGYWQGALGVARADAVGRGVMDDLSRDVRVAIDRGAPAFLVGVPAAALAGGRATRLIATVGSAMLNNDDLPDSGAAEAELPAGAAAEAEPPAGPGGR
jgi:hypothetical protein